MIKKRGGEIKIFIGLREIAGYFKGLKSGFDEIGIYSVLVDISGQLFDYKIESNPYWIKKINSFCFKLSKFSHKNIFLRILWLGIFQNFISFFLFFWAIIKFDVFIFSSNSTFFFYLDIPILKLFNKKIIYVFMGSESRPVYISGKLKIANKFSLYLAIFLAKIQKQLVCYIEKYSNIIISIHPQALFHEKKFVSLLNVGFPCNIKTNYNPHANDTVRILHAPSNRKLKGSDIILGAITNLKNKGYHIEYIEITGVSNNKVLEEITKSDFVIDELYSDTPLAGFSTEAAFFGKPAIIGSYYSGVIRKDISEEYIPPSMFVLPENIEASIEKLITDKEFRINLGNAAYKFVTTNWSPKEVALKFLMLINNNYPISWLYDPNHIKYIYGWGLSKESVKNNVNAFINKKGIRSLCLKDKPDLEKQYLNLIFNEN